MRRPLSWSAPASRGSLSPIIRDTRSGRPTTGTDREIARIRERLTRLQDELRRVKAEERVLAEQVAHLDGVADEAETRHFVAQTPLAEREWRVARTDRDQHAALLAEARADRDALIAERDSLLDRLFDLEGMT